MHEGGRVIVSARDESTDAGRSLRVCSQDTGAAYRWDHTPNLHRFSRTSSGDFVLLGDAVTIIISYSSFSPNLNILPLFDSTNSPSGYYLTYKFHPSLL
jgi:hypothetical protein